MYPVHPGAQLKIQNFYGAQHILPCAISYLIMVSYGFLWFIIWMTGAVHGARASRRAVGAPAAAGRSSFFLTAQHAGNDSRHYNDQNHTDDDR